MSEVALDVKPASQTEMNGAADGGNPAWPSSEALMASRFITLSLAPKSAAARALTDEVMVCVVENEDRLRSRRKTSFATMRGQVEGILGDILKARFKDRCVSAHSRPDGGTWDHSLFGHTVFWGIVKALEAAGLVGVTPGVQTPNDPFGASGFGGLPSRVWATDELFRRAVKHGLEAAPLSWSVCGLG